MNEAEITAMVDKMLEIRQSSKERPFKDMVEATEVVGLLVLAGEKTLDRIEEIERRIKRIENAIDVILPVLVSLTGKEDNS